MSNMISIDGGGTKTLAVVYDQKGHEVNRLQGGSSNFAVNYDDAKKTLIDVISQLLNKHSVDQIRIGVAGYSRIKNVSELENEFSQLFNVKVNFYSDAQLGLYSVYDTNFPLVYVIGGTGSILYTLIDEKFNRFGGYGHLLKDPGSAYGFMMSFIEDTLNKLDAHKRLNKVQRKFMKKLELKTNEGLIGYINQVLKQDIANLAEDITKDSSDPYVQKLLKLEALKVVSQIKKVLKQSKINDTFTLVLRGGFIEKAPNVMHYILEALNKQNIKFILKKDNPEAVYGGYILSRLSSRKEV